MREKHVVILGAGLAGLELATRLSESFADQVRVTLIDRNDSFSFGFSKLDILFGRKPTEDVLLHYRDISKEGVEFRQELVTSIEPKDDMSGGKWAVCSPQTAGDFTAAGYFFAREIRAKYSASASRW